IVIRMRRRRKTEKVERLRRRGLSAQQGEELGRRWAGFHQSHPELVASLSGSYPKMPGELNDRACDSWEPLVALADAGGGEWPKQARDAAKHLAGADDADDDLGTRLLADLLRIWPDGDVETGRQLVELLKDDDDDGLWRNYGKQGKGLTANSMARILR